MLGMTDHQIAAGTGRTLQTVKNWHTTPSSRPIYLHLALQGIAAGLTPLSTAAMSALDISRTLGIPAGTERYWRTLGTYPLQARIAAAWATRRPCAYHRQVLRNIDTAGTYYKTRGLYRARGRALPAIKPATVRVLERTGYLVERDGRVTLTKQATRIIYEE